MKRLLHIFLRWFMKRSYERSYSVKSSGRIRPQTYLEIDEVISYSKEMAKRWKYEMDGLNGLKNEIMSPKLAYALERGDCDDFASAVHFVSKGYDYYLLTYFSLDIRKAHTVVYILLDGKYLLFDWSHNDWFDDFDDMIEDLSIRHKTNIFSVHVATYDYNIGMYQHMFDRYIKKRH